MVYFLVGIAGIIGALLRYYLGLWANGGSVGLFPMGTFLANISGSFLLGWLTMQLAKIKSLHPKLVAAIGTGLIGSFTTFSTFSVETVRLLQTSHFMIAFIYVSLSIFIGLIMALFGTKLGDILSHIYDKRVKQP